MVNTAHESRLSAYDIAHQLNGSYDPSQVYEMTPRGDYVWRLPDNAMPVVMLFATNDELWVYYNRTRVARFDIRECPSELVTGFVEELLFKQAKAAGWV